MSVAVSFAQSNALVSSSIHLDPAKIVDAVEDVGFGIECIPIAFVDRNDKLFALQRALEKGGPGIYNKRASVGSVSSTQKQNKTGRGSRTFKPNSFSGLQSDSIGDRVWMCDYIVSGIVCAACAGRIEKALRKRDGITVVRVGVITEKLHVCFDTSLISQSEVEALVETLGYGLTLVRSVAVSNAGNVRAANLEQNGDTHVLLVTGMTCANCASKIERTIGALSGVEKVTVSVTENRVVIQMGTSAQRTTGIRTILESVHECGFGICNRS
jgi:copper ion binding protein